MDRFRRHPPCTHRPLTGKTQKGPSIYFSRRLIWVLKYRKTVETALPWYLLFSIKRVIHQFNEGKHADIRSEPRTVGSSESSTATPTDGRVVGEAEDGIYISREPRTQTMRLGGEKSYRARNQI